jgi:hypothetical protein
MIANGAKHPRLQISIRHVVGKAANVQFGVVMAVWIPANDKHMFSAVASHVAERHGLVVKHQVRNCPGRAASKRGLSGSALVPGPVVSRGPRNGPKENPVRGAGFERGKFPGGGFAALLPAKEWSRTGPFFLA